MRAGVDCGAIFTVHVSVAENHMHSELAGAEAAADGPGRGDAIRCLSLHGPLLWCIIQRGGCCFSFALFCSDHFLTFSENG